MPVVKLTLNQESYDELKQLANEKHQNIQDYIRSQLFGSTIFIVDEAIKRIKEGDFYNSEKYPDGFNLPDVYGNNWTLPRGPAGVFGKTFYKYIEANPNLGIKFKDMGKYGRRAHYTYTKEGNNNESK